MEVLKIDRIQKEIAGETLFTIKNELIQAGERVALIGANGVGKSTLLKMIAGEDEEFQGHVLVTSSLAYVPQIKGESAQSGGEQVMQYLKQAFSQHADFLLLDEPTAHLDMVNRSWLIHQLKRYRGAILLVSHDRYFLDQTAEKIWLLDQQTVTRYIGNFSDFQAQRERERAGQEVAYQNYQKKVRQLENEIQGHKSRASKLTKRKKSVSSSQWKVQSKMGSYDSQAKSIAKTAKALEKRVERLEKVDRPKKEGWAKLRIEQEASTKPSTLIRLNEGVLARDGAFLFTYPLMQIKSGDKLALQGRNQAGKSTFATALIQHKLPGYYAPNLKISYFEQNQSELQLDKTALENVTLCSCADRKTIFNTLAMMGIRYDKAQQLASQLSGGERVRLALVKALLSDCDLLLLDEPTNFLDIIAIQALEKFLTEYKRAVLVISHDTAFVSHVAERIYQIENGEMGSQSNEYSEK